MEWFAYLLKVSACTALFFGCYLLFLRKLTFFKINRVYLLATLLLSCIIPLFRIPVKKEMTTAPIAAAQSVSPKSQAIKRAPVLPAAPRPEQHTQKRISWQGAVLYLYTAVTLLLFSLSVWRLLRIFKHIKRPVRNINGLRLISKNKGFTNCSFFNYVFVDKTTLSNTELELFLKHEEVHVKQYHSIDKLLMILAKAVLWPNPVIYLYDKALTQAHEFEADAVTSQRFGKEYYARLILSRAIAAPEMTLVHHFTESPIKERIKMLFTPKSNKMKQLSYAFILPICIGLIGLFGIQFVAAQQTAVPVKGTKKVKAVTITEEKIKPAQQEPLNTSLQTNKPKSGNYTIIADSVVVEQLDLKHADPGNAVAEGTVNLYWKNSPKDSGDKTIWKLAEVQGGRGKTDKAVQNLVIINDARLEENPGCRISGIENDAKYTIVSFEYTATHANDWALLNKEIYLQANNGMKHFQYVKSEGIPLAPHRHNFTKPGETIAFKVYFEKVPLTAKSIDVIERAGRSDFFNFYSVPLPASYFAQK